MTIPSLEPRGVVLGRSNELGEIRELFNVEQFNYVDIAEQVDIAQILARWPLLQELSSNGINSNRDGLMSMKSDNLIKVER